MKRPESSPAEVVGRALERLDAWLAKPGTLPNGFGPPPSRTKLEKARHLPPSLRTLYAAHDLEGGNELIVDQFIRCWPLAVVSEEPPVERDERTLFVFGYADSLVDEGVAEEEPMPDWELDVLYAVDAATEEVVTITRKVGIAVVAEHLGIELEKVVAQLEAGTLTIDEGGDLTKPVLVPAAEPRRPKVAPSVAFVSELLARHFIELREGVTPETLASALEAAAGTSTEKARTRAVLAVFDSDLVDEIFVSDDELQSIAKSFAQEFA